jgi:hypothetical protein
VANDDVRLVAVGIEMLKRQEERPLGATEEGRPGQVEHSTRHRVILLPALAHSSAAGPRHGFVGTPVEGRPAADFYRRRRRFVTAGRDTNSRIVIDNPLQISDDAARIAAAFRGDPLAVHDNL